MKSAADGVNFVQAAVSRPAFSLACSKMAGSSEAISVQAGLADGSMATPVGTLIATTSEDPAPKSRAGMVATTRPSESRPLATLTPLKNTAVFGSATPRWRNRAWPRVSGGRVNFSRCQTDGPVALAEAKSGSDAGLQLESSNSGASAPAGSPVCVLQLFGRLRQGAARTVIVVSRRATDVEIWFNLMLWSGGRVVRRPSLRTTKETEQPP